MNGRILPIRGISPSDERAWRVLHDHTDASWIDTCSSEGNDLLLRLYPGRRNVEMLSIILEPSLLDRAVVAGFMATRPLHRRWYDFAHSRVKAASPGADQSEGDRAGTNQIAGDRSGHSPRPARERSSQPAKRVDRCPPEIGEGLSSAS